MVNIFGLYLNKKLLQIGYGWIVWQPIPRLTNKTSFKRWITYIIYSCLGIETNVKMLTDGHVDIYMDNWTSLI